MILVCATHGEGAPSLRFLQGRVAMLPIQLLSGCTNLVQLGFVVPALRKLREGQGTHSPGRPPNFQRRPAMERSYLEIWKTVPQPLPLVMQDEVVIPP